MTVPYTFGTATTSIPLSNLDANFNTPITLGNTSIYLGNTTTTIGNLTLTNATISSGNVTISNISVTTANVTTANVATLSVTGTATIATANITTGNITTLTSTSITDSGLTSGRVTFAGASGLLSDSANLVWDNTNSRLGIGISPADTLNIGTGTKFRTTHSASVYQQIFSSASGNIINAYGDSLAITADVGAISLTTTASQPMIFQTNNATKLTITGSSNYIYTASGVKVGIGLSNPATTLDIVVPTGTASIKVGDGTVSGAAYINLQGVSGAKTWFISSNYNVGGALEFTQSTANGGSTIAGTASMLLDSSGNLGLGVTPSAWTSGFKAMQMGANGSFYVDGTGTYWNNNWFLNSSLQAKYLTTNTAQSYEQANGKHAWYIAPSDSAGATVTFTQAMTLDASGNLLVGTTSSPSGTGQINAPKGLTGTPAFSVYRGTSNQSITTSTTTKVELNTEEFDTANAFDSTTNYRFTPLIAGYYQISGQIEVDGTAITRSFCLIYKNGTPYKVGNDGVQTAAYKSVVSVLVYLNGSTDYIELYGWANGTSPVFYNSSGTGCYLTGVLVRGA